MFLLNVSTRTITAQKYGSYNKVNLKPKEGFRINDKNKLEVDYYKLFRGAGLSLVTDDKYYSVKGIKPNTENSTEDTNTETSTEDTSTEDTSTEDVDVLDIVDTDTVLTDDEGLSPDAVYTVEFLTKKKAITILEGRGVEFDPDATASDLKDLVVETNPK